MVIPMTTREFEEKLDELCALWRRVEDERKGPLTIDYWSHNIEDYMKLKRELVEAYTKLSESNDDYQH